MVRFAITSKERHPLIQIARVVALRKQIVTILLRYGYDKKVSFGKDGTGYIDVPDISRTDAETIIADTASYLKVPETEYSNDRLTALGAEATFEVVGI